MFNIVLSADDNYIKYASVLIASIITHTDTSRSFKEFFTQDSDLGNYKKLPYKSEKEGYIFHILSEDISLENKNKLEKLAFKLGLIYPCEIKIHSINHELLGDCKLLGWGEGRNFTAYYRLLIPTLLECKTCLYLDVDMFVLKDIREVFTLDLGDFALATVQNQKPYSHLYNSGFLLFNIEVWQKQNLQEQCLKYLAKYPHFFDQGALNAVIKNQNTLKLPLKYNFWLQTFDSDDFGIFTSEAFKAFKEEVYIIHYIRPKPWRSFSAWLAHSKNRVFAYQSIVDLWWKEALEVPYFAKELYDRKLKINDELSYDMTLHLIQKDKQIQTLKRDLALATLSARIKNHLSYKWGVAMINNSKSLWGYIRMPYVLSYIKEIHKQEQKAYNAKILKNPTLKLPPLEYYLDYEEALKIKECLSYKLGNALVNALKVESKNPFKRLLCGGGGDFEVSFYRCA